jgi:predicted RNA-binding Zn-ribbon protein involved in translation (DUF1610 family)
MKITWDVSLLEDAVKTSECFADVCRKINLPIRGKNYTTLKAWIKKLELDTSHFKDKASFANERSFKKSNLTDDEFFVISYRKSSQIKNRLTAHKKYECEECGVGNNWNGKNIVLQLDHINGNHIDNTLTNLRFLCPNCHSQTSTYAGKLSKKKEKNPDWRRGPKLNRRKVEWPSKENLLELMKNHSMVSIGKMFNVSDVSVRKWAKSYGIL